MPKPIRVKVKAAAKVNLSLRVGQLQADGFHPIETLYQSVDLYDDIVATPAPGIELVLTGDTAVGVAADESNLAWRAAQLLAQHAGITPKVRLEIVKRIPVAGGMAGGSADAAGTLLACDALWQLQTPRSDLLQIAAQLGSDIPFSLVGGTQIGRGHGDELTTVMSRGELSWVFALDSAGLSTPAVYREFDRLNKAVGDPSISPDLLVALAAGNLQGIADNLENDLQVPAISLRPTLARTLAAGKEAGALAGIVSGSGPTCAFLARDRDHALRISIELQASGVVQRTLRATGPAKGATIIAVDF